MSRMYEMCMELIELREGYPREIIDEQVDEGPDRDGDAVEQVQIRAVAEVYKRRRNVRTDREFLPEELCEVNHEESADDSSVHSKSMSTIS